MYSGEKLPRLKPCNLSEKIKFALKKIYQQHIHNKFPNIFLF